jgi:hypothetical protein
VAITKPHLKFKAAIYKGGGSYVICARQKKYKKVLNLSVKFILHLIARDPTGCIHEDAEWTLKEMNISAWLQRLTP